MSNKIINGEAFHKLSGSMGVSYFCLRGLAFIPGWRHLLKMGSTDC